MLRRSGLDSHLNEVSTVWHAQIKLGGSRVAFLEKRERCVGDVSREVEVKSLDVHFGAWALGASRTPLLLRLREGTWLEVPTRCMKEVKYSNRGTQVDEVGSSLVVQRHAQT